LSCYTLNFLWNLSGSLHDPMTLRHCMPAKAALRRWRQGLMPAGAESRSPWTTAAAASKCLASWTRVQLN
jgi:hypothetical protein